MAKLPAHNDIHGTSGPEDLIGTGGVDWIFGHEGKDRLYAQGGDDQLFGGQGADLLDGGTGRDLMFGGSDDDIYRVDNPGDVVSEETVAGVDDGGVDYVQSQISYALGRFVERLELVGTGPLNGTGNELDNTIKGNASANIISGGGGSDILYGFEGNDILRGGTGKDYLTGGTGADTFLLGAPDNNSADRIYDFENTDKIGIYAADYGLSEGRGLINGVLDPDYFATGAAATKSGHGQFVFNPANTILYWDPDGTGSAARVTLATLSSGAVVTANQITPITETPAVSVSATQAVPSAEDAGAVYFLVSLQSPAREDVLVTYSTQNGTAQGGSDFVAANSAQLVIAAGSSSAYLRVDLLNDNIAENVENFSLVIQSARLATSGQNLSVSAGSATGSIVDEAPRIVASIDTAALGIPDPSGIAYHPGSGTLFLSDSEVDESPFSKPTDLYGFDLTGPLKQTYNLPFTSEATGLAFDPKSGNLFITDDDNFIVYRVNPANPTVPLGQFNTLPLGCDDPEDIAIDPVSGHLFIVNGLSHSIVETNSTGTQVFNRIDLPAEISDPEAIAYNASTGNFYVGGGFSANVWVVNHSGQIVQTLDVLTQFRHPTNGTRVSVKDMEFAPASDGSGETHLYVADFGWSHVNDGRIVEVDLGDSPGTQVASLSQSSDFWG